MARRRPDGPENPPDAPPGRAMRLLERLRDFTIPALELRAALQPFIPMVMAAFVFGGGVVLMVSGSLPANGWRTEVLSNLLPLPFAEASHLFASLAGLALIVLSQGLARRMAEARIAATVMLLAGAGFTLIKGLNWEEALLLVADAGFLTLNRQAFYRQGHLDLARPSPGWLVVLAGLVLAVTGIGWIAHANVAYRTDLWWQFAWSGDAPRFMRASVALLAAVGALALARLVNRPIATADAPVPREVPPEVRRLVAGAPECSRNLALLGDKHFMVAPGGDAFLMYGIRRRSWVCLGGPTGAPSACEALIWQFADLADRAGARPVFCAVNAARIGQLLDLGHTIAKMGEIARIDLRTFTLDGSRRKDLRNAVSRAERDGLSFSVIPSDEISVFIAEIRAVSDIWLGTRKGSEKGFALGSFDPRYLAEFDLAVMRQNDRIVAFANLWRAAPGTEIGVDLMRHLPGISPVLMDAFFVALIRYARSEGYEWFWMGGAPLSGLPEHRLAPFWSRIGSLIYRHGNEVYGFGGLRSFKQKFGPVWSPQYLTCPAGFSLPRAFLDVAMLCIRPGQSDNTAAVADPAADPGHVLSS